MFRGVPTRLQNEIKAKYLERNNIKTKYKSTPINIINSPHRLYSSFLGGIFISEIYNKKNWLDYNYWISLEDWNEKGHEIIRKKCESFPNN